MNPTLLFGAGLFTGGIWGGFGEGGEGAGRGGVKVNLGVIRKGKFRVFILFCVEEGLEWNRLKVQRALQNSVSS